MPNTIHLLGYSKVNLPLFMDLFNDLGQSTKFVSLNNLLSQDLPVIPNVVEYYDYEIIDYKSVSLDSIEKAILGVTNPRAKRTVYDFFNELMINMDSRLIKMIHPTSYVAASSEIGKGSLIEPNVTVSSQTIMEKNVTVKRGCQIGHHNHIESFSTLNPGCTLSGFVKIGEGCEIGTGSVLRDRISIGKNTVIGMGSVVTKSIPSNVVAYGNPCKVIKSIK